MQGGLVLIIVDNCSLSNSGGETERGSKVAVHESVCICDCGDATCLDSHASLGLAQARPRLNFLPNHTTVPPWTENRLCFWLLFDTSVLLQFGKRGWTDFLSRALFLSVFHLRDQQPSDERFFSLPKRKKNPTSEKHTPHLEYKINSNWDTLKLVVGWNKGCMFLPLYCRDIEWWMINDEPK